MEYSLTQLHKTKIQKNKKNSKNKNNGVLFNATPQNKNTKKQKKQ
jgi:hypothetical protein